MQPDGEAGGVCDLNAGWELGNDHQQNGNKWVVIHEEEIYSHLFLGTRSMNWFAIWSVCLTHIVFN